MASDYSPDERELLRAVRHLVRADREMRRRLGTSMSVNTTDLQALRHVIRECQAAEQAAAAAAPGAPAGPVGVTPRRLADHLQITTAATTTLVDRLVRSGHLERVPHPADRRSVLLVPTARAREEMHAHLSSMHVRMKEIAAAVPAEARPAVVEFLSALTGEMEKGRLDVGG
ncbi:MarR family winged helix-turn-helix transcriptional regulator [Nocardioides solisilvae]|uniref:MarR family winged helix-turn-helix transcriptional regulator n=1 Tax=Nocardioides solisilvae TaxID=1542435 RepID=UPI000D7492A9|nr:MarR family transcriptional regulator [Nocardioides solisilvae]